MRYCKKLTIISAVIFQSACVTSIKSVPLSQAINQQSDNIVNGLVYRLPATALSITAKYKLLDCESDKIALSIMSPKFETRLVADNRLAAAFVIDPQDATAFYKQVKEAKLVIADGILKAVNFDAQDHTRSIVASAVGISTSLGGFSQKSILKAAGAGAAPPLCNIATMTALGSVKGLKLKEKNAKQLLAKTQQELKDALSSKLPKTKIEQLEKLIESQKVDIAQYASKISNINSKFLEYKIIKTAIPRKNFVEDNDGKLISTTPFEVEIQHDELMLKKWFKEDRQDTAKEKIPQLVLRVSIRDSKESYLLHEAHPPQIFDGIYHRVPVEADITLGIRYSINSKATYQQLAGGSAMFPQMGITAKLQLTNGLFEDNRYEIDTDDYGTIKTFTYQERNARASEALGTIEDSISKKNEAKKSLIEEDTALINALADKLEAEKRLQDAESSLVAEDDE